MRRQRLTQLAVDRLKLDRGQRVQLPDGTVPGMELRASWGGAKAYWLRFRHGGRQWRHRLGEHPAMSLADARAAARALLVQLDQGINPLVPVETRGTVREVYEEWLRRDQAGNRTLAETKRIFEVDVLPAWGARQIESIRRRDVIELIDAIRDRGVTTQSNRILARIRRLFAWACARDLLDANPAQYVEKLPERSRDRVLEDAELAAVWHACETMGAFGAGVRLLLLTAGRRSEIFRATWTEIDLSPSEPVLRLAFKRTKVEARNIPLNPLAVEILRARLPAEPDSVPSEPAPEAYVISLTGEHPLGSIGKLKRRLDARLPGMAPWTLHDLRRSVATGLQRLGTRLEAIEAVLGHVSGSRAGIVGRYQKHTFEAEARAALDAWGAHVARLVIAK